MTLLELLNKSEQAADSGFLRDCIKLLAEELLDAGKTAIAGAEPHQRTLNRATYRNGYRERYRPIFRITDREAEILELLSFGLEDKEITSVLGMSLGTLRTHLSRLFLKTNQRRRSGLVAAYMTLRAEPSTSDRTDPSIG
ncbi:MAG: LuxR C-terminal-related transcriptional regulator [Candidatus Dormiibacterota bacterium]